MEANTQLMFVILGMVIGIIIGLAGYRLFSRSHRELQATRQKLIERDRQVAELRGDVGEHMVRIQHRLATIRHEAEQLEAQLSDDSFRWQIESSTPIYLDMPGVNDSPERQESNASQEEQDAFKAPRDYAVGKNGTLSEDFGLKEDSDSPQPARH
ncbi:DUF1043 family protein [Halomonas sp. Bachu 37]|uniref:ZapG family protein n=1 Tax=Halomonas kashgarensis TaxID=3084920 RepID=UPI00321674C2